MVLSLCDDAAQLRDLPDWKHREADGRKMNWVVLSLFRRFFVPPLSQQVEKYLAIGRERAALVIDDVSLPFY